MKRSFLKRPQGENQEEFLQVYDKLIQTEVNLSLQERSVWSSISKLPEEHRNYLYYLILHDYLVNRGKEKALPFGCKLQTGGKGVLFFCDGKMPDRTKKLVLAYLLEISK